MAKRSRTPPVMQGEELLSPAQRGVLTRLRNMAKSDVAYDRWHAVENMKCPSDALDLLLDDEAHGIKHAALRHPNLSSVTYARVWEATGETSAERLSLMWNPNAPVEYVRLFPLRLMLKHPKCDPETMMDALTAGLVGERETVARSGVLTREMMMLLIRDKSLRVRRVFVKNGSVLRDVAEEWIEMETSPPVLRDILKLPCVDGTLAGAVAMRLREIGSVGRLSRAAVAKHSMDPVVVREMVHDTDPWVAGTAATNTNLTVDGILDAATHPSAWVRDRAVSRPDSPEEAAIASHLMNI